LEQIDSLKKELAAIEGQPVPEAVPVEPTEEERIAEIVQGVKDYLAKSFQEMERDEPAKVAAANQKSKTCCECYFVQPLINAVCELCGAEPFTWMQAKEHPANRELDSLREAAKAPVDRLQTMLRSGWCSERPERERVVKNILAARLRQRDLQQHQAEIKPLPPEVGVTDHMIQSAIKYWDRKVAKLDAELEELNRQSGKVEEPVKAAPIPWYLEPAYLEEERKREELAKANADRI
jgi:hypothetical protein